MVADGEGRWEGVEGMKKKANKIGGVSFSRGRITKAMAVVGVYAIVDEEKLLNRMKAKIESRLFLLERAKINLVVKAFPEKG